MDDIRKRTSDRIEFLGAGPSGGRLIDISTTGACCYHEMQKEKDAEVLVKINDVLVKGRVVYCQQRGDGFRLGLQFHDLSDSTQRMIGEIVDGYSKGVPVNCSVVERES